VRLSGVYLAMLTLAFSQIAWSVAFQWDRVTGGSNGLIGAWPAEWLASKPAYFYLVLVLCGAGVKTGEDLRAALRFIAPSAA